MIDKTLKYLHDYGREHNIPIIDDDGAKLLIEILEKKQPQRILELGTAIGYSALLMYKYTNAEIYTIERDTNRYDIAKENLAPLDLSINLILADALEVDNSNWGEFDLIYFDAAKAQNQKFFEKYIINLAKNGVIIIDNLFFHGIVLQEQEEIESRNMRQLSRKLRDFIKYAQNLEGFEFQIINHGDGIGILKRKEDVEI